MSLIDGNYRIMNVKHSSFVVLGDQGDGSSVRSTFGPAQARSEWTLTALNSGRYTLCNVAWGTFANVGTRAPIGSTVEGRVDSQHWIIMPTRFPNRYTISTSDTRVFWGVEDGEEGTPVSLVQFATDSSAHWIFQPTTNMQKSVENIQPTTNMQKSVENIIPCCTPHRRAGVSTRRLTLAPRTQVDTLPFTIQLMRDGSGETGDINATDVLQLVATLRNSLCHLPVVFNYRCGGGFWGQIRQFHGIHCGWTFAYAMQGLIDLASTIPGPATIDFTRVPLEQVEVVNETGDRIDTNSWHAGVRCVAAYCLQIIRALPEHTCVAAERTELS